MGGHEPVFTAEARAVRVVARGYVVEWSEEAKATMGPFRKHVDGRVDEAYRPAVSLVEQGYDGCPCRGRSARSSENSPPSQEAKLGKDSSIDRGIEGDVWGRPARKC